MEMRLFHMIARKAFQGPMHRRVWGGQILFSCGNIVTLWVFNVPSPSSQGKSPTISSSRPRQKPVSEILLHIKVQSNLASS